VKQILCIKLVKYWDEYSTFCFKIASETNSCTLKLEALRSAKHWTIRVVRNQNTTTWKNPSENTIFCNEITVIYLIIFRKLYDNCQDKTQFIALDFTTVNWLSVILQLSLCNRWVPRFYSYERPVCPMYNCKWQTAQCSSLVPCLPVLWGQMLVSLQVSCLIYPRVFLAFYMPLSSYLYYLLNTGPARRRTIDLTCFLQDWYPLGSLSDFLLIPRPRVRSELEQNGLRGGGGLALSKIFVLTNGILRSTDGLAFITNASWVLADALIVTNSSAASTLVTAAVS